MSRHESIFPQIWSGVECGNFFLIGQNMSSKVTKGQIYFRSPKIRNLSFTNYYLDPRKSAFFGFWRNSPPPIFLIITFLLWFSFERLENEKCEEKNCVKVFFFKTQKRAFLGSVFFLNNWRTNVHLFSIFENAQKNSINRQKRPKWRLDGHCFLVHFQKYRSKELSCIYCF